MTNSFNPDRDPKSPANKRVWLLVLSRGGIALGGLLLVAFFVGAWRLWTFVEKELTPLAQKNLTSTLNRPVQLGAVKDFSLRGVRFGASSIPATPTDPDRAKVEGVEVGFDLWQLLINRQLKLDVTLVNPDLYIAEDDQGRWISTKIAPPGPPGPVKTDLDKIHFRNAQLVLAPNKAAAKVTQKVTFGQLNGYAQLRENNQLVWFDVTGKPATGGDIAIRGETRPKTQEYNLQVQMQDFLASDITRIVKLPLDLQGGRVNQGNVQIKLAPQQLSLLYGSAAVQGVRVQVPRVPQAFINSQGTISFQGTQVNLENVATNYGKIPLLAKGTIDREAGFKLAARVNAVSVPTALETLKVKSPLPASGEVKADVQLVGPITKPILSGTATTIKPAKIDKVDFNQLTGKFEFSPAAAVITFKDIRGKVTAGGEVTGAGNIELGQIPRLDFNFLGRNLAGDAIAKIYDINPALKIGTVQAKAQLTGGGENVQTAVQFQAPDATYPATGEAIVTSDRTVSFRNVALNVGGGKVRGYGTYVKDRFSAVADASGVLLERFVDKKQLQNVSLADAQLNGRFIVSGTTSPFNIASIKTEGAAVNLGGGTVAISNIQLQDKNFAAQLVANNLRLSRLLKKYPPVLDNPLGGTFQIAGNTDNLSLKTIQGTGEGRLGVGGGTVTASNIQLAGGAYQAKLQANNVDVQKIAQVPQQIQGNVTGQFNVAGTVDSFELPAIQATGEGHLNVAGGIVTASNIQLDKGRYQAQLQANNVPLQRLATVPPQFQGPLTGKFNVAGSVESFKPETIQLTGQGRLNVAGGIVTASNIQLEKGKYQAAVDATGVQLNRINQEFRGLLGGKLQVAGSVGAFNLANLRAAGDVQLSQGVAIVKQPLNAAIAWDGKQLIVNQATAPDLTASGIISTQITSAGLPEITDLNLNVQAQNYNLQELPLKLPNAVTLVGRVDYNGQISGKVATPNLQGQVSLRNLVVNNLAKFEPVLTGKIQSVQGQGLKLDLAGTNDRIALDIDANNRPNSFSVRWNQVSATGVTQGENLAAKVENFPLEVLKFTPPPNTRLGAGVLAGLLSGDFQVNRQTFATTGNLAVNSPKIGRIIGDRLEANFRYNNNVAEIFSSKFAKGASSYAFAGTVNPTGKTPQIKGKVNVTEGNIQDVLTAVQLFELQDFRDGISAPNYGTAADLNVQPEGFPEQALFTQIQRFYEIQAQLALVEQQRLDASVIPDLKDLNGTFNGEVALDTTAASGLAVNFDLVGKNFVWGKEDETGRFYRAEQIIAQGNLENGVLRLLPLRIESKDRLIAFTGNIGGDEQSGQLRVNNFPVKFLNNFVPKQQRQPFIDNLLRNVSGNLNGTATLAGSLTNPQAKGELQILDGTLQGDKIQSATASFSYGNGRLNFGSNVALSGPEPVTIQGEIPYQLPFASATPSNDEIKLDLNVKNEGLRLLSLFTDQVAFEKGTGEVDLKVTGTKEQPVVIGTAILNGATFSAQALPGLLTDVSADVKFDFDRISVENLQGNFSRGQVKAVGQIPLSNNLQTTIEKPLSVTLDKLALNLKGLYKGGASGNLNITGSVVNPAIGGEVTLANGEVSLSEADAANPKIRNSLEATPTEKQNKQNQLQPQRDNAATSFNNLQLTLGNNVEITRAPILDFRATGTLIVNGSLNRPSPVGVIRLRSGGVNLFTTQFSLARGYKHTATFSEERGLDPDLDIRLIARVPEITQTRVPNTPLEGSEFKDNAAFDTRTPGRLDTIRVEARVSGPASQLNENLELTSEPSRSKTEIVGLLGGSFVDTLGRGDSTLGLANLAGSALLNNFQGTFNQIGNAFGLSELRLFPTIIPNKEGDDSSLGFAAEAGVDISPRISISGLKILTNGDPLQFGVNYRINEQIRVRASTNLFDDSRAIVEYDRRF